MAKKQAFGADAAKAKQAHRKMAKVIVPFRNEKGTVSYKTAMIEQDTVGDFIKSTRS